MRVAVVAGARSPFTKAGNGMSSIGAYEIGRQVLHELVIRSGIDRKTIDELIVGNVANPAEAENIARVVALMAELPMSTSAYTVHRNCASAMQSISDGVMKISGGYSDVIISGGVESMTNIPLFYSKSLAKKYEKLFRAKNIFDKLKVLSSVNLNDLKPVIGLEQGLTDPVSELIMGGTAENIARDFNLSRKEQDEYALKSHQLASAATKSGRFAKEIVPVMAGGDKPVTEDNGIRHEQTMDALSKLKPIFAHDSYATVTAGNSSQVTDGAAFVILMSEERAKALGYKPLGYIRSSAYAGCDPSRMGMGPAYAVPKALTKAGLKLKDIDLVEINEAFAAVVLCNQKAWASQKYCSENIGLSEPIGELNLDITNVNGGAIALGHPVGVSGTRLVLTLLHELAIRNKQYGLATLCIGGGQGGAMVVERE